VQQLPLYANLEAVKADALRCQGCVRSQKRSQVVFGAGNRDAALMLIGDSPSATDDATGFPYSGPAGDYLDELLKEAGIHRNEVYITNVVRCFTAEHRGGGARSRASTARERSVCDTWTDLEIQFVSPAVILAVGAPAASHLIGDDFQLIRDHGTWRTRSDGRQISATMQPTYVPRIRAHDPERASELHRLILSDIRSAVERATRTN
jgi:uracil-DNA glycosylase